MYRIQKVSIFLYTIILHLTCGIKTIFKRMIVRLVWNAKIVPRFNKNNLSKAPSEQKQQCYKLAVAKASALSSATKVTCPCNEDPLTPHFYIVKQGFTGVFIFSYFCSKT